MIWFMIHTYASFIRTQTKIVLGEQSARIVINNTILSIYLTYFRKWFFPLPSFSSNQTLCWGLQFAVRVQTSSFCDGMYLSCIYLRRDGANVNNVRKTLNYPHKTNIITLVNEEPWNQNNIWYLLLL